MIDKWIWKPKFLFSRITSLKVQIADLKQPEASEIPLRNEIIFAKENQIAGLQIRIGGLENRIVAAAQQQQGIIYISTRLFIFFYYYLSLNFILLLNIYSCKSY